jgi:hypothetical protein
MIFDLLNEGYGALNKQPAKFAMPLTTHKQYIMRVTIEHLKSFMVIDMYN